MTADQDHTTWAPARTERPDERLERVDGFAGYAVLSFRSQTRHRLRVVPLDALDADGVVIEPAFDCGTVMIGPNTDYDATAVTVEDQSYIQPPAWSDVDLAHRRAHRAAPARGTRPRRVVVPLREPDLPAPDGTPVPVTLVRHRDTPLDGTAPALLWGYGAYEAVYPDQEWDPAIPSLLDRGVVYAHAHVRGGGEGGRRWWLDGRLQHKQHTFGDYAAVADGLADGLVDGDRIASRGLSAGGLLQGAVFSQRPDRWRAVVAEVPFVDVVTTMFDASIPLTITEWDEWGDPRRARGVRLAAGLLAVRQPAERAPSRPARHRGAARPARDGLRARQVGRPAARDRSRMVAAVPVPRRDGRRCPRRPRGSVRPPRLRGRDLCLDPRSPRAPPTDSQVSND